MNVVTAFPRQSPTALEAEQALLGAILINNDAYRTVAGFLRPDHFGEDLHGLVYEVAGGMIERGERADAITVAGAVPAGTRIGDHAPIQYLAHLVAEAATVVNAPDYGRAIFGAWARRTLAGLGMDLAVPGPPIRDMLADAESRLIELAEEIERAEPSRTNPDQDFEAILLDMEDRRASGRHLKGATSGLRAIDDKLSGFAPGELILLAARPSMGKTALGLSMARLMALKGVGVAFDSIEMREAQIRLRLIADETEAMGHGVPYVRLATGRVDDRQAETARRAGTRLQRLPLPILDHGNRLSDIPGHIRSARRALERSGRGLEVFLIDYLGLLVPGDRYRGNRVNEVTEISSTLKALAKREGIAIIALHQLNRANESRDDKRPRLSDLRDSGALEQDADAVMFVHREHYYLSRKHDKTPEERGREVDEAHVMEVLIDKNRQGQTGAVKLWCDMGTNSVRDLAP